MKLYNTVEVPVEEFASNLNLQIVYGGRGKVPVNSRNVTRPGLQLSGYFEHFDHNRIQVIGMAEHEYCATMSDQKKGKMFYELFSRNVPCLIVARSLEITQTVINEAKKFECPIFLSPNVTTHVVNDIYAYLTRLLAPETRRHGVLMDVSGVGVLIEGHAGIGKSELALELINRGHRLVADDSVIIRLVNDVLVGTSPERIRNYMEIRGLGIINVQTMWGPGSVRQEKTIDIVVELEKWDQEKKYDRIGDESLTENILGVDMFKLLIPVSPGRNIPTIIETAARKYRLKQNGYDAATELLEKVMK